MDAKTPTVGTRVLHLSTGRLGTVNEKGAGKADNPLYANYGRTYVGVDWNTETKGHVWSSCPFVDELYLIGDTPCGACNEEGCRDCHWTGKRAAH